jgi:hypothetical protein
MQKLKSLMPWSFAGLAALSVALVLSGCASENENAAKTASNTTDTAAPASAGLAANASPAAPGPAAVPAASGGAAAPGMASPAIVAASAAPMPAAPAAGNMAMPAATTTPAPPVRIKAGTTNTITDADGNTWLPDQGFTEGETVERPDAAIVDSKSPQIYRSEHWGMSAFDYPVPNGKYIVKLHFCETYDGITAAGDRVFGFNVNGKDFTDFDVWAKGGGYLHPYVETVPVEVTDGKVHITFTPKVQNPEINGIEILPAP